MNNSILGISELKWTATAKSLQSCLTLCDSIGSSPPGSSIPGILQARTLEWGATAMNQRKLEVAKQEMARVNTGILGISELKWTAMGEFNSDDIYLLLWARRNGVALIVNKSQKCSTWMQSQK